MILVTKMSVVAALEAWFVAARSGTTMSAQETAMLSASEAALASADFMYQALLSNAPKQEDGPVSAIEWPAPTSEPQAIEEDLFN